MTVRNRFRRLFLIHRVADELWMEVHDNLQETGNKTISKKKEIQQNKIGFLRRPYKWF